MVMKVDGADDYNQEETLVHSFSCPPQHLSGESQKWCDCDVM